MPYRSRSERNLLEDAPKKRTCVSEGRFGESRTRRAHKRPRRIPERRGAIDFADAKMGAEVIPGLLESIRKATTERRMNVANVKAIIKEARRAAYAEINAVQIDQNWKIGKRIVEEEQDGRIRAEYGKRTIAELSAQLFAEFGEGYSERNLRDFRAFYVISPDSEIWHTRVPNLSRSHFRLIMRVSDPVAREWFINEASNEHWGVRTLDRNNPMIGSVLLKDRTTGDFAFSNCHTLCDNSSWAHYCTLITVENKKAQQYYFYETVKRKWSVCELQRQIKEAA
jgi:hypothetical protein